MTNKKEFNKAFLVGLLESSFEYDYVENDERIYSSNILITRVNGGVDRIPITISESRLARIRFFPDLKAYKMRIEGYFVINPSNAKTKVSVRIEEYSWESTDSTDLNRLELTGVISGTPKLREVSNGKKICDFCILTRSQKGKILYVNAIAWDRFGNFISKMKSGSKISLVTRIQNRVYRKEINGTFVNRTFYDISVINVEL